MPDPCTFDPARCVDPAGATSTSSAKGQVYDRPRACCHRGALHLYIRDGIPVLQEEEHAAAAHGIAFGEALRNVENGATIGSSKTASFRLKNLHLRSGLRPPGLRARPRPSVSKGARRTAGDFEILEKPSGRSALYAEEADAGEPEPLPGRRKPAHDREPRASAGGKPYLVAPCGDRVATGWRGRRRGCLGAPREDWSATRTFKTATRRSRSSGRGVSSPVTRWSGPASCSA